MRSNTISIFVALLCLFHVMNAESQWKDRIEWTEEAVHSALKELNPEYNGGAVMVIEHGQVKALDLTRATITDITPLGKMGIQVLDLRGLPLEDISALEGLPLNTLGLEDTFVDDLSPLAGMKLETFYLNNTPVKDIKPLAEMPLKLLNLYGTNVDSLEALRGMPLEYLWLNHTPVSDISPLVECPLISLTLQRTQVEDISPVEKIETLQRLHIAETSVTDLTPIKSMKLTRLIFSPEKIKDGIEIVRNMDSLQELGMTLESRMPPEQFWQYYDDGRFEKKNRQYDD